MKLRQKAQLKHNRSYYIKWISRRYSKYKKQVLVMLFLTLMCTAFAVLLPIVLKYIVDNLVSALGQFEAGSLSLAGAKAERTKMLLYLFAIGCGVIFLGYSPFYRGRMNIIFEMFFREKYFASLFKKTHRFFTKYRTGDMVTRLTEDIKTWPPGLSWLCCSGVFRAVNSASIILFCFIAMLCLDYRLTLTAALPMPILAAIYIFLETNIQASFKDMQEGMSETNDFLEAAYSGVKIIASFNARKPQTKLFGDLMQKRIKQEIRVDTLMGLFAVFFEFLSFAGEIIVLVYGGILVIKGELSIGGYYAFFSYLGMIIYPLMDIPMLFITLSQACVSIDRLEHVELTDTEEENKFKDNLKTISSIDEISFENVCFKHSDNAAEGESSDKAPFELKNLNFSIKKGTKTAIVGKIGSGKTTLINLVCGLLRPDSGAIKINDTDISRVDMASYRDKLGYIQQDPVIFSASVAENISFWRGISESTVVECSKLVHLDKEVMGFAFGYTQEVGQRGITLSGGQRQRLAIARALAGAPQVLLMDDITASLDAANEKMLWNSLNDKFSHLTCLIVTHRASTAMMADNIIVLQNGKIESCGSHNELIKNSAVYRELAKH